MITISNLAHSNIQSKVLSRAKVIRLHNDEHDDEGLIEDSWKVPYFNSELLQAYAQLCRAALRKLTKLTRLLSKYVLGLGVIACFWCV